MVVLVAATSLRFGASWGNPVGVAVLIASAILAAIGIMALVATLAKNAEQAGNWQAVVAVVDSSALLTQVERGNLAAGLVIPAGYDAAIRAGHAVAVRDMARTDQSSQQLGVRAAPATPARARALLWAAAKLADSAIANP